jgi:hydroxymethylglutaryl-CoA lyase
MTQSFESRALLRDVTLRDGLQLTGKMLPTARKLEIAR